MNAGMAGLAVLGMLTACADDAEQVAQKTHRHVSPTPVAAPVLPPGSFDQARGKAELAQAQAALTAGRTAEARQAAEAATRDWPADPAAWTALGAACQAANDPDCVRRAALFKDKVDYVNPLPPRVAVLGFQSLAEEGVGDSDNGVTYDQATIDTATRLWAFYDSRDPMTLARLGPSPDQEEEGSWLDQHPYAGMAVFSGVVAGVLTGLKSATGK